MSNQTIADHDTPDPWMLFHDNAYYLTFTAGDRVEIWKSRDMENFRTSDVQKAVAFKPPAVNPWVVDLWAPELHYLDTVDSSAAQDTVSGSDGAQVANAEGNNSIDGHPDRQKKKTWYIYFTGANPAHAGGGTYNAARRTLLLRCKGTDPMAPGAWEFLGQVKGLSEERWNIDATVFYYPPLERAQHQEMGSQNQQALIPGTEKRKLYCCFSAWPVGDLSDTQQDLFLVEMVNPEIARPETEVCISRAELKWERTEDNKHGVNEGPTFISIPLSPFSSSSSSPSISYGFHGIVYSANGSWTSDYRLGVLQLVGADPLQMSSWRKRENPLLISDRTYGGPFGPGHASFIVPEPATGASGTADKIYCIYHATEFEHQGWDNRKARVLGFEGKSFLPGAETVCCALALTSRARTAGSATDAGTAASATDVPSPAVNAPAPEASGGRAGHTRRKSLFERIWGKAKDLRS